MSTQKHFLDNCFDTPGPARSQQTDAPQFRVLQLPPHNFMPAKGTAFNRATYITIPAVGVTAIVLQFTVPAGKNGIIDQIANNFVGGGFTDGSGAIVWRVLLDNVPAPGLENMIASLGNPAAPSRTAPVRIFENQLIELVVQNVSINPPAGQLIGGRLSGYFYPKDSEEKGIWY
jgi:hypothetical protein